jgi:Bifunctional DNA primase/polymerase, N-terminal
MILAEAAQWWARRGFPVFPVEPRGKRPLSRLAPHGVMNASNDCEIIASWWQQAPTANIGLAIPKGVFVRKPKNTASSCSRRLERSKSARK